MRATNAAARAVILLTSSLFLSAVLSAGDVFRNVTTTAGGFSTWDADLMDAEQVPQTGRGVYVAVLDTGLVPDWSDYLPEARVATSLGAGFEQPIAFTKVQQHPCTLSLYTGEVLQSTWIGSRLSPHGTHVASTIVGYKYQSRDDQLAGYSLPPILVRGIAPDVTLIPVKVMSEYQIPAMPDCDPPSGAHLAVFGTSRAVSAGIDYVTDLAIAGYRPMVINMSFGGRGTDNRERAAIDRAVANGVIVVAAAGNMGAAGMAFPAAYQPVISVGSAGWIGEFLKPGAAVDLANRYPMWWLKYPSAPLFPGSGDMADPTALGDVYVSEWSSRALPGQELDVLAPGSWVRGPFPYGPGYAHEPWWANGIGDIVGPTPGLFQDVGGTSQAAPHVTAAAALLLQKNPSLTQTDVASILKSTALPISPSGSATIIDYDQVITNTWESVCGATACDAVGAGLVRVPQALAAVP